MAMSDSPERKQLIARIPDTLHMQLGVIATIKGVTINAATQEAVQTWVDLHAHDEDVLSAIEGIKGLSE